MDTGGRLKFMVSHGHDTIELRERIQQKMKERLMNGEMSEQEYREGMEQWGHRGQELKSDIITMKAEKMKEVEEEYVNDEITEDELEQRMDELFENGEDFLDTDTDESEDNGIQTEDILFRLKEVSQLIAFVAVLTLLLGAFIVTKGKILIFILPLAIVGWCVYIAFMDLL